MVKHEALAIRRQRERVLAGAQPDSSPGSMAEAAPPLDEQATGRERIRQTAEALSALKRTELECLLLKALGYSYNEIAARTGYSWTKVNRCLTEGRRRFLERFGEIASGARCREYESLLSRLSDGEQAGDDARRLELHLRSCVGCRAALRSYRTAPGRLAELLPPGLLLPVLQQGTWLSRAGDWLSTAGGDRAGAVAWKLQQGAEALTAQKAAAVVASTAALAGGAAVHEHAPQRHPARETAADARPHKAEDAPAPASAPSPVPAPVPTPAPPTESAPAEASQDVPSGEFAPGPAAATAPDPSPQPAAEFDPAPAQGSAGGGGEFGP